MVYIELSYRGQPEYKLPKDLFSSVNRFPHPDLYETRSGISRYIRFIVSSFYWVEIRYNFPWIHQPQPGVSAQHSVARQCIVQKSIRNHTHASTKEKVTPEVSESSALKQHNDPHQDWMSLRKPKPNEFTGMLLLALLPRSIEDGRSDLLNSLGIN